MSRLPSDVPNKLAAPAAHAFPMPEGNLAYFQDGSSQANWEQTKRIGSVAILANHATLTNTLVMALGYLPEDNWMVLDGSNEEIITALTHTPRGRTFISDAKPRIKERIMGSVDFPIVETAELSDLAHPINNYNLSGKKKGAAVIGHDGSGGYALYVANGHDFADTWVTGAAGTNITPTGTLPSEDLTKRYSATKPKLVDYDVTAIPLFVYSESDLGDISHPINAGDGTVSGKLRRAMVVADSGSTVSVRVAQGGAASAPWFDLLDADATDPITPS